MFLTFNIFFASIKFQYRKKCSFLNVSIFFSYQFWRKQTHLIWVFECYKYKTKKWIRIDEDAITDLLFCSLALIYIAMCTRIHVIINSVCIVVGICFVQCDSMIMLMNKSGNTFSSYVQLHIHFTFWVNPMLSFVVCSKN